MLSIFISSSAYPYKGGCSLESEQNGCKTKSHTVCHIKTGECNTSTSCICPSRLLFESSDFFNFDQVDTDTFELFELAE
jgi:hypothetical protein